MSAEKGTAMHEAISAIWKSEKKGVKEIETILKEKISEYFNQSLLPVSEKESAKKELFENASDFAKSLESHFALNKGDTMYTESWVETELLDLPIHGKLDAVIDNGNEVKIFDYKSRQSMSINAIKGLTKSDSEGNYFRQLVFYKILVSQDVRWKNRKISPALVFVSPDEKGRCPIVTLPIENSDIEKVKDEIQTLKDSVWSGEILKARCGDPKCEWCGLRGI